MKCPACNGFGTIEFTYWDDYYDEPREAEEQCPICCGYGNLDKCLRKYDPEMVSQIERDVETLGWEEAAQKWYDLAVEEIQNRDDSHLFEELDWEAEHEWEEVQL